MQKKKKNKKKVKKQESNCFEKNQTYDMVIEYLMWKLILRL